MKVSDLMTRDVVSIGPDKSAMDAARMMKDKNVGTVMVVDGNKVEGLITDRAIAIKAVAEKKDPKRIAIRDIMTRGLVECREDEDIHSAMVTMGENKIRRCPVVNSRNELVGVVSMADFAEEMKTCMDSMFDEMCKAAK